MTSIEQFFIHTVSVEAYLGRTPTGDSYAPAVPVRGFMDQGLVVSGEPGGVEITSKSTFFTGLDQASVLVPQSRVTYAGDVSTVSTVRKRDGGDSVLAALSHLEVTLS